MRVSIKRCLIASVGFCLLLAGLNFQSASAATKPFADGQTIRWSGDGWWQVQDAKTYKSLCEGRITKCKVGNAGRYNVINHTTGKRWPVDVKTGSSNSNSNSNSSQANQLRPPTFVSVGYDKAGFNSVIWETHVRYADGVDIYRNNVNVGTVRSGTVFEDHKGRPGDRYSLAAFRDGKYSPKTAEKVAAMATSGQSAVLSVPGGVSLSWRAQPGIRYTIRRLDSGGTVRPSRGTVIAKNLRRGEFTDTKPRRGASYGIEGRRSDNTVLPIVTVKPNYDNPTIKSKPTAFEMAIHWQGSGGFVVTQGNRYQCTAGQKTSKPTCTVPKPGHYKVTHLASRHAVSVDVKGLSPIVPKRIKIGGRKYLAADTYYGTQVIMKNPAEVKAVTGVTLTRRAKGRSGKKETFYSVTRPGKTPQEVSANGNVIVHEWEVNSDGTKGDWVGSWIHGEYVTDVEYDAKVDTLVNELGKIADVHPGARLRHFLAKLANTVVNYVVSNTGSNSGNGGGNGGCNPRCDQHGVPLNPQTDPDNDGVSVFGDTDNDNDGVPTWLDDNDLDPNVGCSSDCGGTTPGGSGTTGGDSKGDTNGQPPEPTPPPGQTPGGVPIPGDY